MFGLFKKRKEHQAVLWRLRAVLYLTKDLVTITKTRIEVVSYLVQSFSQKPEYACLDKSEIQKEVEKVF